MEREADVMLLEMLKSAMDNDRAPVVMCNLEHTIVYMNPTAARMYQKYGGAQLVGKSLLDCHNPKSKEIIERVVGWFAQRSDNNMIYTFRNEKENKDVYMVALRNAAGELIGYYEKHEYRTAETAALYDFSKSLV